MSIFGRYTFLPSPTPFAVSLGFGAHLLGRGKIPPQTPPSTLLDPKPSLRSFGMHHAAPLRSIAPCVDVSHHEVLPFCPRHGTDNARFSALANLTDRVACPRNPHHSSHLEHSSPFSRSSPYPSLYHRCSPTCPFTRKRGHRSGVSPIFPKLKKGQICITWIGHASF